MYRKAVSYCLLAAVALTGCARPAPVPPDVGAGPGPTNPTPTNPTPTNPTPTNPTPTNPAPTGAPARVLLQAGEVITRPGIYFRETATDRVEGWQFEGMPTWVSYRVTPDNRWVGIRSADTLYLIDRKAERVDLAPGHLITAAPGRVLLMEPGEHGGGSNRFRLLDEGRAEVARFTLPHAATDARAVVSPDGHTALLAAYQENGSEAALYRLTLGEGELRLVHNLGPVLTKGEQGGFLTLWPVPGSGEVLLGLATVRPSQGYGISAHYLHLLTADFGGTIRLQKVVQGTSLRMSPDGRHLSWQADIAGYAGAIVLADRTGEPLLRIKRFTFQDRWATDGSGILIQEQMTVKKVTPAGTVEPFPPCQGLDCTPGITPTPDDPRLLLLGRTQLITANGDLLFPTRLAEGLRTAYIEPFGASSAELRLVVEPAYGGTGWDGIVWQLPLAIERAPFDDRLVVKAPGDCLNLRERPERTARARTCVPDGTVLVITRSGDRDGSLLYGDGAQWVYVRTEQGAEGWASTQFVGWLR